MPVRKFGKIILGASAVMLLAAAADFKDLSTLQTAATYARDNLDRTEARHRDDVREVQRQQQIVADKKKELDDQMRQLSEAQKNAEQSQQQYQAARKKYEKAQSELDAALNRK